MSSVEEIFRTGGKNTTVAASGLSLSNHSQSRHTSASFFITGCIRSQNSISTITRE